MEAPQSINTQSWPWCVGAHAAVQPEAKRARVCRRPDVSGYFTFTLVSALMSGGMVLAEMVRTDLRFDQWLAFAAHHPMTAIFGCLVVILAGLLAVGDV